uniref:Transcriptional regulator in cluster with Zn-dependent hydrolase n=1 Tax=Loigolactobacillus rennini TaxID=238013 RepID=A0A1K2I9E0_9LACO|nr:Transcriptional regulator in cluster with Zn-dependent hydrolase [Loigolactobacillus rennini]
MQNKREIVKTKILTYIKKLYQNNIKKLPSEENMTQTFGVSRVTIRAVLSELASEGVITRRQGYGTFISDTVRHLDVQFNPVTSYNKMIEEFGYHESSKILTIEVIDDASKTIYHKLHVPKKSKLVYTTRLFFANDTPCVYCTDYFPLSLLQQQKDTEQIPDFPKSIFSFLSRVSNHKVVKDYTQISTVLASNHADLSHYFLNEKTTEKSFLKLACINYNQNDEPVIYAQEYVDTQFIKFFSVRKKQL